ncbi:MAG: GNAT family N-acetyltransferase [Candidatus Heimdallarchaeota archaeon]|nr:GNAT family N-acetyltransferase [Candidatus Heimdallarchaeota archaeon]
MSDIYHTKSPFIGEKVKLRPLEKEDLDDIMEHWNTYESRIGLGLLIPMSSMMEAEFIESAHSMAKSGKEYVLAIEEISTGNFLGTCGVGKINSVSRSAELGITIHNPANHSKGYGTDAMKCLLKFGFNILNFHRIELWVMEYNERAIHVYKKVGFKEVGRKREAHYLQGSYHNVVVMDILEEEFREKYKD